MINLWWNKIFFNVVERTEVIAVNNKVFTLICYYDIKTEKIKVEKLCKVCVKIGCDRFVQTRFLAEVMKLVFRKLFLFFLIGKWECSLRLHDIIVRDRPTDVILEPILTNTENFVDLLHMRYILLNQEEVVLEAIKVKSFQKFRFWLTNVKEMGEFC